MKAAPAASFVQPALQGLRLFPSRSPALLQCARRGMRVPKLSMSSDHVRDAASLSRRGALRRVLIGAICTLGFQLGIQDSHGAGVETCSSTSEGKCVVPKVRLGTLEVSRIIQGHWQLAGGHGEISPTQAVENMKAHYDAGITTLDTADIYGPSESIIGEFLKERPDAVVCTKFCCFRGLARITKKEVKQRIEASCKRMGVKRLDLVAFFWLDFNTKNYVQVAEWLSELKDEGLIREIGVTNFDKQHLQELVDAGVPVVSNQIQYSILDRRAQNGLSQYCAEKGIKLLTYGSVGGGLLSDRFISKSPPKRSDLDTSSLQMYAGTIQRYGGWEAYQALLKAMDTVAKKHDSTIANVAARYVLEQEAVGSVIIGVRNSKHIAENVKAFSYELDDADKALLKEALGKAPGLQGDVYGYERGYV